MSSEEKYPTELVVERFPKIFSRISYLEISDGWCPLVEECCAEIQALCDSDPEVEQVVAAQVKQKFRELRFYYDPYDPTGKVDAIIGKYEARSLKTCEGCGAYPLPDDRSGYGWGVNACEPCDERWKRARTFRKKQEDAESL